MSIEQAEKEKSLDYWNAVEGWVELPKAEQPTAWVYPEGLGFTAGQAVDCVRY